MQRRVQRRLVEREFEKGFGRQLLGERGETVETGLAMAADHETVGLRQCLRIERKHGQAFGALGIHASRFDRYRFSLTGWAAASAVFDARGAVVCGYAHGGDQFNDDDR